MINMLRKGIKFSIQTVYFPQSYFESRHYGKRFNSIGKFKSLTFQLRAIYFHTFAVDMSADRSKKTGGWQCNFTQELGKLSQKNENKAEIFALLFRALLYTAADYEFKTPIH